MYAEAARYEKKRHEYITTWNRLKAAGRTFAYIDESGFMLSAQRDYGWALRGQKVHGTRSGQRRPRTSLIAALVGKKLIEPMLFDGTCDTEVFNLWLEKLFCPVVKKGTVVVIDNAAFHKSPKTRDLIHGADCELLFLPPYSPDLMPIEQKFASLKKNRQYNENMSLGQLIRKFG